MDKFKGNVKYFVLGFMAIFLVSFFSVGNFGNIYSESLDNDVEVEPNSELTYFLDIKYDGVDKEGVESSDTTVSNINSTTMRISDKIPEGLTFTGFVTTSDGTIGAVQRDDRTTSCIGKVVDDTNESAVDTGTWNSGNTEYTYHGLHYDKASNTVNFDVKNLKAGCILTVGIKTQTPSSVDDPDTTEVETRRDFYNHGVISEGPVTLNSNIAHVYMGDKNATLYTVKYEYEGEVPEGAPTLTRDEKYASGTNVGVANQVNVEGYTFTGWDTTDVSVSDSTFTMPSSDVTLKGRFTKLNAATDGHKVTYEINGAKPESYVEPSAKDYFVGSMVNVDTLKEGDVIDGYRFLGWETTDVTVSEDNDFEMPDKDVKFVGKFEQIKYKVHYHFYDGILPPNANSLLPATREYAPGENVTVAGYPTASGYEFLGWYKESSFEMPEEDVHIYGEWKVFNGTFTPQIAKSVEKGSYKAGETAKYTITVTNTASFPIREVIVRENNPNAKFVSGTGYTVNTDHFVTIASIPAGGSATVKGEYVVTEEDPAKVTNEVEIRGALSDTGYELTEDEIKATAEFTLTSEIEICKNEINGVSESSFNFKVGANTITVDKGACKKMDINPGTYAIKEEINGKYAVNKVEGAITSDNSNLIIEPGKSYKVTYTNERLFDLVVHHYKEGTTEKLGEDETSTKKKGDDYSTNPLTNLDSNYELVSTPENASGTVNGDTTVTYYYKKKQATLTVKYVEEGTNTELSETKTKTVYFGDNYTTEEATDIPNNYTFKRKTDNYQGVVSGNIEVIYYYVKKDSNIDSKITKSGTEEITSKNTKVVYNVTYEAKFTDYIGTGVITIVDNLPYKIDEASSNLDGGVYDASKKTITWTENVNVDSYTNDKVEITKNVELKYTDIDTSKSVMTNKVTGNIKTSDKDIDVENTFNTRVKIPGTIIVKYIDKETGKEIVEHIMTTGLIGTEFTPEEKTFDGYKLVSKPEKGKYAYTEKDQVLEYVYERIKVKVETKANVGGTIEGDEVVNHGADSTKDKIKIKANDGYVIDKVLVNGKEITIPENLKELIVPNFLNMLEDKLVEVSFRPLRQGNADVVIVPPTAANTVYTILGILGLCAIGAFGIYYNKKIS